MKKQVEREYETLRNELVKTANDFDNPYQKSLKDTYSRKRKSTINKIRYKIANLTMEEGDI